MIHTRDLVADSIRNDPQVLAACEAIDKELLAIYDCIPSIEFWPNVEDQWPPLLDVLAWEMHVDIWQGWEGDLDRDLKIQLINESIVWHQKKGTKWMVEHMVQTIYAEGFVTEWYQYGGNPYFFKISIRSQLTPPMFVRLVSSVMAVKNVRSWIETVELLQDPIMLQLYIGIAVTVWVNTKITWIKNDRPV